MNHNPPPIIEDYHQPWKHEPQLIQDCGGATDNNGITWEIKGKYYAYPGEDAQKLYKKYSRWHPSVNIESMVLKGHGMPIPDKDVLEPGAMEEYSRLIKISHIKYVKKDGQIMVTREFN